MTTNSNLTLKSLANRLVPGTKRSSLIRRRFQPVSRWSRSLLHGREPRQAPLASMRQLLAASSECSPVFMSKPALRACCFHPPFLFLVVLDFLASTLTLLS
jgi:hypothetical protein